MPTAAPRPRPFPPALRVEPVARPLSGTVVLPGSKSITNRALLIAGLATGESVLENALFCEDSRHLAAALPRETKTDSTVQVES